MKIKQKHIYIWQYALDDQVLIFQKQSTILIVEWIKKQTIFYKHDETVMFSCGKQLRNWS